MEKENIVALFSIFATICGTLSRGPQVYRVYTTKPLSINDLSTNTMILNIGSNSCILIYMAIYSHYSIVIHCGIMILFEVLLIYMKNTHGKMKKSSSQTNLLEMDTV